MSALALLRALHYATTLLATGALGFELLVAPGTLARHRRILVATAIVALLSALGWLVAEAQKDSGGSFAEAMSPALIGQVLRLTEFGHVWTLRLLLLALWPIALARPGGRLVTGIAFLIGLMASALLAFAGHAAAEGLLQQLSDMLHLALAALWLGGLLPIAAVMAQAARAPSPESLRAAQRAARRFSPLGILCVGGLLATGLVNAWTLVGTLPGLIGTDYGRLLLLKLAALLAMIAIAAINRQRLTPALAGSDAAAAARRLRRNALLEAGLGVLILVDVGWLGISVPAAHDQALWPLPVTWSAGAAAVSGARTALAAGAAVAGLAGLAALLSAVLAPIHRRRWLGAGGVLIGLGFAAAGVAFAEAAVPTLYLASPFSYSVATIAAGERLYAANCVACHGTRGYGDGPAAASLGSKPADIAHQHVGHHPDGLLLWWILHGKPETAMPGFAPALDRDAGWQVLAFLHANADAELARGLGPEPSRALRIPAPDFNFERGGEAQQSLAQQRGRSAVLLVLYRLPGSAARLERLSASAGALDAAGLRVVALPAGGAGTEGSIFAAADPDLLAAYALFARGLGDAPVEFLIDPQGNLRARWTAADAADPARLAALARQLAQEPVVPAAAPMGHMHMH